MPEITVANSAEILKFRMGNRLRLQNYDVVGEYPESEDVWFKATGSEGQIIGGFRGEVVFEWLNIQHLFIELPERGKGLGSRLLLRGEEAAKVIGAKSSRLETFSFQAPQFYLKHGYRELYRIEKYFRGRAIHVMVKDL
jgi:GNAT superfamily N-acetyltransferase